MRRTEPGPGEKPRAPRALLPPLLAPLLLTIITCSLSSGEELALPTSGGSTARLAADLFPDGEIITVQLAPTGKLKSAGSRPRSSSDPLLVLNDLPDRSLEASGEESPIKGTAETNGSLFPKTHGEGLHGGTLVGLVYDGNSVDPLSGVGVIISEANLQTLTNDIGEFVLKGLEPKQYDVTFVQQGYQITTVKIAIGPGLPTRWKQALEPKALDSDIFEMEGIEVFEEFQEENSTADRQFALREMTALASSIGAAEFSSRSIGDAAGAVKNVAGANIVDGKYAVIRGLGDRYSATTMNGAIIPSSDPSRKAVQLDLFPTDLIEELVISKTFTPDMSGEFAGGSVDIKTLKFPEKAFVNFGYSQGWNSATGNPIAVNPDRRMDFFGRVNDALPSSAGDVLGFPDGVSRPNRDGSISPEQQLAADTWNELHASGSFLSVNRQADPNRSLKLIMGSAEETPFGKAGLVFGFTHDHDYSLREGVIINRGDAASGEFLPSQGQIRNSYDESIDWGILVNGAVELNEWNQVSATYMTNTSATDSVTQGRRIYSSEDSTAPSNDQEFGLAGSVDPSRYFFDKNARVFRAFDEIAHIERKVSTVQFNGTHRLNRGHGPGLDWLISEATAKENRPDQRNLKSFELDFADPTLTDYAGVDASDVDPSLGRQLTIGNALGGNPSNSFREYLSTVETGQHVKADLTIPVIGAPRVEIDGEMVRSTEKPNILEMKGGVSRFDRQRQVRGRIFKYTLNPAIGGLAAQDTQSGIDTRNGFDDLTADGINNARRTTGDFVLEDQTRSGDTVRNVDASSLVESFYLMSILKWDKLEMSGGARHEHESRTFFLLPGLNNDDVVANLNPEAPIENEYWLPAANLTYYFGEKDDAGKGKHAVRFAYGKTIARPTFYEFAPILTVDQKTGLEVAGNPELVDTVIDNYDVRWEYFPSPGEVYSVSLFSKNMTDPIVTTVDNTSGSGFRKSWQNADQGSIQGAEAEFRKYIDSQRVWNVSGNFTYIDSLISGVVDPDTGLPVGSATVFEGQPTYIANFAIGYDQRDWGISANLIYNFTSEILTDVSADPNVPNIFLEPQQSLDFVISKTMRNGVKLKFAAKNLLDQPVRKYYEGQSLTYEEFTRGREYSVGLSFDF